MLKQSNKPRPGAGRPKTLYLQTDLHGTIQAVSSPLLLTTGKGRQDLIGQSITSLVVPEDAPALQLLLQQSDAVISLHADLTIQGIHSPQSISFTIIQKKAGKKQQPPSLEWHAPAIFDEVVPVNDEEKLFRQFADASPGMIWISDEEDNTVYFNKTWLQFTGITVDDVAEDGWTRLIHPDDISVAINGYRTYFKERKPATLEYRIKTKSDQYRWVIDQSAPRYHADGRFLGYIGSVMDIHDRKVAEETVYAQAKVMRHVSDAIISTDNDFCITVFNHAAEKIYGLKAADVIGKSIREAIPHEYLTSSRAEALKDLEEKGAWGGMMYYDHPAGNRVFLHVSLRVLRNEKGDRTGIAAIHHDITETRRAEEALRISEERYRSLVHALGEGILLIDKQGNILACNESAEQMLDLKQSDGKRTIHNFSMQFVFEDGRVLEVADYPAVRTLNTGESFKEVIIGYQKNQSMMNWVSVNTEPIYYTRNSPEQQPDAVVVTIVDSTDRKNHQQLLALEKKVLEMNALPAISLKTITDYFLEGLEKLFPGMFCSVLKLDAEKQTIQPLSAPSLPSEYSETITGRSIGAKNGSCGTAMYRKEKVFCTDVPNDPLWHDYREIAEHFNIGACWSFPILDSHQEVLATMAIYYNYPKSPEARDLDILDRACDLLRIIIENKDAERKIRRNHERYLLVTKATNDAIWDWDISTSDLYWGEGYYTLFGYKPGLVPDGFTKWEELIHPDDIGNVKTSLHKYIHHNKTRLWEAEYRFKKADGDYALVFDRGFLIYDHEGKVNRMVGSVQNITDKREMERQLLEQELNKQKLVAQAVVNAQEKERAEIGKDLHDNVNQILTTAKLYLELAMVDEAERLQLIKRCAGSITDAINEVRTLSRSLVPASVGDLGLIESMHDLTESVRATKKLQIKFEHSGYIDELLDDKRKLTLFRIVQEQVNNVLKHSGAKNLLLRLTQEDQFICLVISDDGSGFDSASVRAKKGSGLSNIISRAELFNGVVSLETAPGAGCRLTVQVPTETFK